MTRAALLLCVLALVGCRFPTSDRLRPAVSFAVSTDFSAEDQEGAVWAVDLWCREAGLCAPVRIGEPQGEDTPIIPATPEECSSPEGPIGHTEWSAYGPPRIRVCPGESWTDSVIAHEIGHALLPEIEHTDDPASLMYPRNVPREPTGLNATDHAAIERALEEAKENAQP